MYIQVRRESFKIIDRTTSDISPKVTSFTGINLESNVKTPVNEKLTWSRQGLMGRSPVESVITANNTYLKRLKNTKNRQFLSMFFSPCIGEEKGNSNLNLDISAPSAQCKSCKFV